MDACTPAATIDDILRRAEKSHEPPQIITRRASEIAPEPVSWIWKYWLARGKLHIIGGVPETGKTTIALNFAAAVSSGGTWPDGSRADAGNVLIWTSEDDPADTLVPRLMRMGADLDRIHFIEEAPLSAGHLGWRAHTGSKKQGDVILDGTSRDI
jgi:putative DNA primase/helicase